MSKRVAKSDRDRDTIDIASIQQVISEESSVETCVTYTDEDMLSQQTLPDLNLTTTIPIGSPPVLLNSNKKPSFSKHGSIQAAGSDSDKDIDIDKDKEADTAIDTTEHVVISNLLYTDIPMTAIRDILITPTKPIESEITPYLYSSATATSIKSRRLAEMATEQQRERREWVAIVPSATVEFQREAELRAQQRNYADLELQIRDRR